MKKNKKWTALALICLLMLMVLPVKAETTGSIAIQLHSGAEEVEMTLYKVAVYADEEYTMTEEFQGCGITTKQLLEAKRFTDCRRRWKNVAKTETERHTENKKQMKNFYIKDSFRDCILLQTAGQDKGTCRERADSASIYRKRRKNYHPEVTEMCFQVGAVILNKQIRMETFWKVPTEAAEKERRFLERIKCFN